jgi:hypothetical protein
MATIDNSFVAVEGPKKKEVLSLSDVTDADTVTSTLQNPEFGFFVPTTDTASVTVAINVGISGRTITINSSELAAETGILTLYGF